MSLQSYQHLFSKTTSVESTDICGHTSTVTDRGMTLCADCGIELTPDIYDQEWTVYGTTKSSDPRRCNIRKQQEKSILKDISHLNISEHIKQLANSIYMTVCDKGLHRGTYRKGIIFASVFYAYKRDTPQSCESLMKSFKIDRKDALRGLKFINEHAPKDFDLRTVYITPEHMIREYLKHFSVSKQKEQEIVQIFKEVDNKSLILNRSRPQSVAAGIIWYWICLNRKSITIKEFIQKIDLSELTVLKNAKEIARLQGKSYLFL